MKDLIDAIVEKEIKPIEREILEEVKQLLRRMLEKV
jgi:hypothetical protein